MHIESHLYGLPIKLHPQGRHLHTRLQTRQYLFSLEPSPHSHTPLAWGNRCFCVDPGSGDTEADGGKEGICGLFIFADGVFD